MANEKLWWACLASILGAAMSEYYCQPPPKPYRGSQPLPVFPSQVTADIHLINMRTAAVYNIELFYTPNRVRVDVWNDKGGLLYSLRYNSVTDELFIIKDRECTLISLSKITEYDEAKLYITKFAFFDKQSLAEVLRFGGRVNMEYKGQIVETDLSFKPLHRWYTCLTYGDKGKIEKFITLDYFLVVHNDSQVLHMARPMALRVESSTFGLEMNITRYEPTISQPLKTFSIPRDVVCPGINATLGFSSLGEHYYYEEQIISQSNKHLSYNKIWYSYDDKLLRIDYTEKNTPMTEIHNYKDGVAYYINRDSTLCRQRSITPNDSDAVAVLKTPEAHYGLVVMRNSMQFMKLDLTYHYQGKEHIQGMLCLVYRARRKADQTSPAHIYTYYFLHPSWLNETVDLATAMDLVPVMLIIRIGQNETRHRFLNFRQEKPDFAVFDVSPCIQPDLPMSLVFTIPAPHTPVIEAEVVRTARLKLVELTRIEPRRIQNIHVTHDEISIHLWTTILALDNDMGLFTLDADPVSAGSSDLVMNVPFQDMCASMCVAQENFVCRSFDFCPNNPRCHLSSTTIDSDKNNSGRCFHYSRTIEAIRTVPVNYIDEYMSLRSRVNTGNLTFDATFTIDNKQIPLVATKVELIRGMLPSNAILPAFPAKISYAMVSEQFQLVRNSRVHYDHTNRFLISESRDPYIFTLDHEQDMFDTTIQDMAVGVEYNIDRRNEKCKKRDRLVSGNSINPIPLLAESVLFNWKGQTTVRGVLCDLFMSEMPVTVDAEQYTLLFMLKASGDLKSLKMRTESSFLPMRLRAVATNHKKQYTFNFFEFETDFDASKIDLSPCYHGDNKRRIVITFPVISKFTASTQRLFKEKFRALMTTMFNLTALAMAGDVIDTDERHVYYYITLLQRSEVNGTGPILNIYISLVNSIHRHKFFLSIPTGTKKVKVYASSIATIDPQRAIVAIQSEVSMGRFTETRQATVSASVTELVVSNTAVDGCATMCLRSIIHECLAFVYCYDHLTCFLLNERRVPSNLPRKASCTTYFKNYIEDYTLLRGTVTQVGVSVTAVNAEGCARFCTNAEGCESFNFCPNTHACITSKRHVVLVAMPGGGTQCKSYTRRHFPSLIPSSTRTGTEPTMYSTVLPSNRSQSQTSKSYSPGVMAGTAVGMLVLGLIIPSLVILFIFTRRRIANNTMALETLNSTR